MTYYYIYTCIHLPCVCWEDVLSVGHRQERSDLHAHGTNSLLLILGHRWHSGQWQSWHLGIYVGRGRIVVEADEPVC